MDVYVRLSLYNVDLVFQNLGQCSERKNKSFVLSEQTLPIEIFIVVRNSLIHYIRFRIFFHCVRGLVSVYVSECSHSREAMKKAYVHIPYEFQHSSSTNVSLSYKGLLFTMSTCACVLIDFIFFSLNFFVSFIYRSISAYHSNS